MTTRADFDHELDQHLRRTLTAVADTVQEEPTGSTALPPRRPRRRRRLIVGADTAFAAIPLAAAAVVGFGPEYVDRLPPAEPIVSGSLDGERYWVVDGRDIPRCAGLPSGIDVIAEDSNVVGQEWNTFGYFFGTPTADGGCAPKSPDDPPESTYYSDGGQTIGDGMLWVGALHPDVDQVRVSLGGAEPFNAETFTHEGGTFFALEVPPGTAMFTVAYVVDGEVVTPPAGETAEHGMARD
ncbi:MAG: hypothetical protein AVDCRST_MAG72-2112 [uncultured Nocardioidaceae bacterium]|uniref:Uncharacterized protein n=1 Tax=uncultured Nocardioidaceae bacterium TaxID=253824 RepID=A0A6J4MK40_9ACTN|nr:MAG: hypothetical protein AVDCRST_MAG72-2112 [uncultured Nocardioidaceae bacterium]